MKDWRNSAEYKRWKLAVRIRDGQCIVCGKFEGKLDCHHIIPDRPAQFYKYRTDVNNGVLLCAHNHSMGCWSAHKNPLWFSDWLKKNRPAQYYLAMERLKKIEDENNS